MVDVWLALPNDVGNPALLALRGCKAETSGYCACDIDRPEGRLRFGPHPVLYVQSSDTEESTRDPDPVLPSIISSLLDDERVSRDLELSLVASLELKPLDKLPLPHILVEPQPPLLVEYAEDREFPLLLPSDDVGVPMLVKDRDCNLLASCGCECQSVPHSIGESHVVAGAECGLRHYKLYEGAITVCIVVQP